MSTKVDSALRTWMLSLGFVILLPFSSCTQDEVGANDPKKRLTEYISRTFSIKTTDDRKDLADFLSGEAKVRLSAWSDEQFRQAFIDSKRQFIKLAFQEVKTQAPKEVDITYELVFLDQGKDHDAKVTNKKLASLVQENGRWFISDVRNIKELVEYRNEMSLP